MDRTDADDLLTAALNRPESFDPARTARLAGRLTSDDADERVTAAWALGLVVEADPDALDATGVRRLAAALDDDEARRDVRRALSYIADHDPDAAAAVLDAAVDEGSVPPAFGRQVIPGYEPYEPPGDGSVYGDTGSDDRRHHRVGRDHGRGAPVGERDGGGSDDRRSSGVRPPAEPPTRPPAVDRAFDDYDPIDRGRESEPAGEPVRYTLDGRDHAGLRRRFSASAFDDGSFVSAMERWRRVGDHPAVARLVDYGTTPGPWFVAERGDRGRLADREASIPPDEAHWLLGRVADALYRAHASGVVHGGLHPGAVALVDTFEDAAAWDYPRVTDWGLAVSAASEGVVPDRVAAPEHRAPEQFGGVDAATDVYGLGVVGYVALTGRSPVREDPERAPSAVTEHAPDTPESLATVVAKCLAPRKIDRYETVGAVRSELVGPEGQP